MIEFKNVSISYGKKRVISSAAFSAENGEVTVLVGRNGSGKSSLLRAASRALKYGGGIFSDGVELRDLPGAERAARISYMPQILPDTDMSVRELVMCGRAPLRSAFRGYDSGDRRAVDEILEKTSLAAYSDKPLSEMSGGERQRAYFAFLAARGADTILLDEPTSNLDGEYRAMVYDFIKCAALANKAVLVVLHHISEACRIADKLCVLHNGVVIFDGSPKALQDAGICESFGFMADTQVAVGHYGFFVE